MGMAVQRREQSGWFRNGAAWWVTDGSYACGERSREKLTTALCAETNITL